MEAARKARTVRFRNFPPFYKNFGAGSPRNLHAHASFGSLLGVVPSGPFALDKTVEYPATGKRNQCKIRLAGQDQFVQAVIEFLYTADCYFVDEHDAAIIHRLIPDNIINVVMINVITAIQPRNKPDREDAADPVKACRLKFASAGWIEQKCLGARGFRGKHWAFSLRGFCGRTRRPLQTRSLCRSSVLGGGRCRPRGQGRFGRGSYRGFHARGRMS